MPQFLPCLPLILPNGQASPTNTALADDSPETTSSVRGIGSALSQLLCGIAMLVGFKAENHPQQTRYRGSQKHVDDRAIPPEDFVALQQRFGFTVDVAAAEHNAKCERFLSINDNGLEQSWAGERVYCNPPYSDIMPWIRKAWHERLSEITVMLLPANRTEQKWWQDGIEPYRDRPGSVLRTEFMSGRLRFLKPEQRKIGPNERPPFGCVLCIWCLNGNPVYFASTGVPEWPPWRVFTQSRIR